MLLLLIPPLIHQQLHDVVQLDLFSLMPALRASHLHISSSPKSGYIVIVLSYKFSISQHTHTQYIYMCIQAFALFISLCSVYIKM